MAEKSALLSIASSYSDSENSDEEDRKNVSKPGHTSLGGLVASLRQAAGQQERQESISTSPVTTVRHPVSQQELEAKPALVSPVSSVRQQEPEPRPLVTSPVISVRQTLSQQEPEARPALVSPVASVRQEPEPRPLVTSPVISVRQTLSQQEPEARPALISPVASQQDQEPRPVLTSPVPSTEKVTKIVRLDSGKVIKIQVAKNPDDPLLSPKSQKNLLSSMSPKKILTDMKIPEKNDEIKAGNLSPRLDDRKGPQDAATFEETLSPKPNLLMVQISDAQKCSRTTGEANVSPDIVSKKAKQESPGNSVRKTEREIESFSSDIGVIAARKHPETKTELIEGMAKDTELPIADVLVPNSTQDKKLEVDSSSKLKPIHVTIESPRQPEIKPTIPLDKAMGLKLASIVSEKGKSGDAQGVKSGYADSTQGDSSKEDGSCVVTTVQKPNVEVRRIPREVPEQIDGSENIAAAGKMSTKDSKLSPKHPDREQTVRDTPGADLTKPVHIVTSKILPPLPNLEKISPKSEQKAKILPVKLKRSPIVENTDESSDEIQRMLSKRLGSGLDISILPKKPALDKDVGAQKITDPASTRPVQKSSDGPSISRQNPPMTPYQQRLALHQQSYQASVANMPKAHTATSPAPRQKTPQTDLRQVPTLLLRKMEVDGQRKIVVADRPESDATAKKTHVFGTADSKGPLTVKISLQQRVDVDSSSSSETSKAYGESSSSSHDYPPSLQESDVDFEKIIGSTVLDKAKPHEVPQAVSTDPPVRKRGRPRKTTQVPIVDPNPVVATWPLEEMVATPTRGRRARKEIVQPLELPKRTRKKTERVEEVKKELDIEEIKLEEDECDDEKNEKKDDDGVDDIKKEDLSLDEDSKMEVEGEDDNDVKLEEPLEPKAPTPRKKRRKRGPFYVKRKPRVFDPNKKKEKENFQNFEEETRMSASECSGTPMKSGVMEGDGSLSSTAEPVRNTGNKKGRMEIITEGVKPVTVQQLVEYPWPPQSMLPPGEKPDHYMIQEQISEYLGVKSFKRKYPNIKRRDVAMEERNYLQENGYVTENMCDMGLTAVESGDIIEIMFNDFPIKFDEYRKFSRERKAREQKALREKQAAERADMDPRQEAIESASSWNADFNKARREQRTYYFDLQTFTLNMPRKPQTISETSKIGNYPLALIPGQNSDYYKEYTPQELKYFPLNTVIYGPMRPNERHPEEVDGSDGSDSDDSSSSDDSSNSSSSDDTQDSSSSGEDTSVQPFKVQTTTPKNVRSSTSGFLARSRVKLAVKLERTLPFKIELAKTDIKEEVKESGPRICKCCGGDEERNKDSVYERLMACSGCRKFWHPSCLKMSAAMVCRAESYKWQCSSCKVCTRCNKPNDPPNPTSLVLCVQCDRGHHLSCIGLQSVPTAPYKCADCSPVPVHVKAENLRDALLAQTPAIVSSNSTATTPAKNEICVK